MLSGVYAGVMDPYFARVFTQSTSRDFLATVQGFL